MNRINLIWLGVIATVVLGCGQPPPPAPQPKSPMAQSVGPRSPIAAPPVPQPPPPNDPQASPPIKLEARTLSPEQLSEGWISLFDGQTLFGWRPATKADWRVEDGAIVVSEGEPGLLVTNSQFDNYVLRIEFQSATGTNSGIFLATLPQPEDPSADCYELNIADADNPFPTGSLVRRQKVEGTFDSEQWQAYEVTVDGGQVTVKLDGKQVLAYEDPKPLGRGHIGLQLNQGRVAFRNILLKPLGVPAAFNGKDLTGWKTYPAMDSEFTVGSEGELTVKDGPGQIETTESYADFVLQLECISHTPGLNSGIFFRCIPGDKMMGYESQINNAMVDGDPMQPADWGTGAIFRRQKARLIVVEDPQWFHKTILTNGPHMAVWVNGYQVSDWTDTRSPHENPRKGLRVEAGTLMIQGHDKTTHLSFRNLRLRELVARK